MNMEYSVANYQRILKAYINHVLDNEGIDYLVSGHRESYLDQLSEGERSELYRIASECDITLTHKKAVIDASNGIFIAPK